jgi:succinate dehydrogenase / fumarate reductase cytochrome b subunit
VFYNLVTGLSSPAIGALYVVANIAIGIHLYHGAWSLFQSLGLSHRKYDNLRRHLANGIAFSISGGFVVIALAVMLNMVKA